MINRRLEEIRKREAESHQMMYSESTLFSGDGWLAKPVKTVIDILPQLDEKNEIIALDLGCGVGRNCIPIAQYFSKKECVIDCVDILGYAIEKLEYYANKHLVGNSINGIVSTIDKFQIKSDYYDLIIAVSALEHMDSVESFKEKLFDMRKGIKDGGIVCIIMNSEISEQDAETLESMPPHFEINIDSDMLISLFRDVFTEFYLLKETVKSQSYAVPRGDKTVIIKSNVVTFVVKKCES